MHYNIILQPAGVLVPAISVTSGCRRTCDGFGQGADPQAVREGMSNTEECGSCHLVPVLDKQCADTVLGTGYIPLEETNLQPDQSGLQFLLTSCCSSHRPKLVNPSCLERNCILYTQGLPIDPAFSGSDLSQL